MNISHGFLQQHNVFQIAAGWLRAGRRILQALALRLLIASAVLIISVPAGLNISSSQTVAETELQIKAGFIYNFALFVQWPDASFKSPSEPVGLCIAAGSAYLPAFEPLKTKKIMDRPVAVFLPGDNSSRSCHILYIPGDDTEAAARLLKKAAGPGVLTIGDARDFASLGGIIGFYREGNKLRFEINTDAASRAGLKLSSQLLKLAKIVNGSPSR